MAAALSAMFSTYAETFGQSRSESIRFSSFMLLTSTNWIIAPDILVAARLWATLLSVVAILALRREVV